MTVAEQLFTDAANLSVILLGIALLAGQLFRRKIIFQEAAPLGKVPVEDYRAPELLIALGMIVIFYIKGTTGFSASWLTLLAPVLILVHLGPIRNLPILGIFGLDRKLDQAFLLRRILPMFGIVTLITLVTMWLWQWWLKGLVGDLPAQPGIQLLRDNPKNPGIWMALFIQACIFAPIAEEILFRGFLYPVLKRFIQPFTAAVVVAGIFAIAHPINAASLAPLFVLGILLVICYEWTGTLWAPILVHFGFNAFNLVYTFASVNAG
ncbi:MAG: type II CAAX endopeptidase family protein [Verrucomicrobiota bacterium]